MQNTLLWTLVSKLSPVEINDARRWLASPVHNRRQDIQRLMDVLATICKHHQPCPDRVWVWQQFCTDEEPFDDQEFRLRCAYLLRQLEDWMAWRAWQKDGLSKAAYTLSAYRERQLDLPFQKRLAIARRERDKASLRSADYYLAAYRLEAEAYEHTLAQGRRLQLQNLEEQDHALTNAFLSLKLRQACLALAHKQVSGAHYRLSLVDEALAWAQRDPYAQAPAVAIYRDACLSLMSPDDEAAFAQFQEAISQYFHRLPPAEMRDLLLLAINACIRRINQGRQGALADALRLYRLGLDSRLLLENGWLTPFTYNNIAVIGIGLRETQWVEDFIHRYKVHLEPSQRETHFALNAARLAYHRGAYGATLSYLQQADYRDFFHQMMARMLQLKVYFATGESDLLEAHIKNTRAFLRRQRAASYHEQNYRNILQITEKMMRINPNDKAEALRLRELILLTDPLTEREWLLSILDMPGR